MIWTKTEIITVSLLIISIFGMIIFAVGFTKGDYVSTLEIIPATLEQMQKLLPPGFVVTDDYGDTAKAALQLSN